MSFHFEDNFDWYFWNNKFVKIVFKLITLFYSKSNLIWDDTKVSVENISDLKSFQRYNHFVAMSEISR